jgi:aspartyl-tRNA synthetase
MRSTPEGARDFVVPSRLKPGSFYALPQSPQILKQLLMLSGYDRYYQLARCYRDEDARGDRQPEFTQLDFEMSFVDQEEVLAVLEVAFAAAFREGIGYELPLPFTRVTFAEAMNRYGSDRPDLRFELELQDFTELARGGQFGIFKQAVERGDTVKALRAPGLAGYSRRRIEELEEHAKTYGAAGLAWMKCGANGLESGVARFYQAQQAEIYGALGAEAGDLLLLVAAPWRTACTALGAVRTELARREGLAADGTFHPCFVTDFPLFAWNEEEQRWDAEHHMFSMPQAQFLDRLEQDPGAVRGELYDAVINGLEVASGSIRIHDPALQRRVFAILGVSEAEAAQRFGFMLDAFRYGAPPHGGAAIGFDRTVMLMAGEATIREVLAFPKNTWAASPMDDSPAPLDDRQLRELQLAIREPAGR